MITKATITRIPLWAYMLVFLVLLVLILYIIAHYQIPVDGAGSKVVDGECVITTVKPGSPAEMAGLIPGDIIKYIGPDRTNGKVHAQLLEAYRSGDSVSYVILRNGIEKETYVTFTSLWSQNYWFYIAFYLLVIVVCTTSIYILYKKPYDKTARVFFIYLQLFAIAQNFTFLHLDRSYATFASIAFIISFNLYGVILFHFHLIFPRPVQFYKKIKVLLNVAYLLGAATGLFVAFLFIMRKYFGTDVISSLFDDFARWSIAWMALSLSLALTIAIYQFRTAATKQARSQLRLVLIGSVFGLITPIVFGIYPEFLWQIAHEKYQLSLLELTNGAGTYIMTSFLAIAIFKYRIWNIEPFIRQVILYGIASIIIYLTYLTMLFLVDIFFISETRLVHFIVLAFSTLIFLLLKDFLQRFVDRLFYRESYISAKVVADFELHFAGVYQFDHLSKKIGEYLDNIYHFKSFAIALKNEQLFYKTAYQQGSNEQGSGKEFEITIEIDELITKAKVFSTEELKERPLIFEESNAQLIVPLINGNQTFGFFILGEKLSEKSYTMQDIILLVLLSRRVVSLYNTANLYRKDLERQVMLQRERTRIARDIHDDVGANLTRITIMSENVKNKLANTDTVNIALDKITDTCREVTQDLTQIIWALDPKKETYEGLIASIRRFAIEYLDPARIKCVFEVSELKAGINVCPETRRNVFLSVREVLHNVVKHAKANTVWISIRKNKDSHNITVRDDGIGFNPSELSTQGNGLVNIKKRISNIGGNTNITSSEGSGTVIQLSIPIVMHT